eukprot:TRINITY_DN1915_c0_g1_i4.p1 TRINITY_DN1915_c0_g1~~TRINITY_DN1915_c0_g1_i4.p1  ORF type:complete len:372 (-),score=109.87 TRINITY_DN1915_c0_g1_i4:141-1256(-)
MESTEKQIRKIICSEDEIIEVDVLTLSKLSPVIRNKLAQESDKNEEDQRIVVNNVTTLALEKIMDYCNVHVNLSSPRSNKKIDNIALWDENFVKLEPGTLCELASAAYHLEVKPLVDLTCQAIAYLLKGKSPAEIRKTFNIPYDFSPEDDAPPPTVRDKLRNKLCFPKKKAAFEAPKKVNEDQRTVQELLNFINDNNNTKKKKKKKKKTNATPNKSTPNPKSQPNPTKSTNITTPTKTSKVNGGNNNKINNTTNVNSAKTNINIQNSTNNNIKNNNTQQDNNNNKNSSNKNDNTQNTNPSNKKAYDPPELPSSRVLPEELLYDVEEDEEDPELDEELEEFRRRLNNINVTEKISLPSSLSQALVGLSQNNK